MLYGEEARLAGTEFKAEEAVDSILANNLHGIDIDARAVQIAAAALFVKAREHSPTYRIRKLNLVATDLGLEKVTDDDPALLSFISFLREKAGLLESECRSIINCLKTADYMGSLLQVNELIKSLSQYYSRDKDLPSTILRALTKFIRTHDDGNDLGVQTLAGQMEKGMRLIELLGTQYDVIVANPPYLSLGKIAESIADRYALISSIAKGDMYTLFMLNNERMTRAHGSWGVVAQHNWMFLGSFEDFRVRLLKENVISCCAQLGTGAFEAISGEVVGAAMFVAQKVQCKKNTGVYQRLVVFNSIQKKIDTMHSQERTYGFPQERFADITGSPMIYWWPEEFRQAYLKAKKLGEVGKIGIGFNSGNNERFLRKVFEICLYKISIIQIDSLSVINSEQKWIPYIKGAEGKNWFEPLEFVVNWKNNAKEKWVDYDIKRQGGAQNPHRDPGFFNKGSSYSYIGTNGFQTRLHKVKSVFDISGSTIFTNNPDKTQVLLSSRLSGYVSQSINPTINNQSGDIKQLPILDYITDYQSYLDRARALYDELFASTETNIEYRYHFMESERFEVEEARIRDEIDKEILAHFSPDTIKAIYEEIGDSPFDYPACDGGIVPDGFADAYQTSDSILDLAHQYRLHPDTIIDIKNTLRLVHQSQRQENTFQHLSWAIGVLLGRFDADTCGLSDADSSVSQGLIYLTALDDDDGFKRPLGIAAGKESIEALRAILEKKHGREGMNDIWSEIEHALVEADGRANVGEWIRLEAFARHKELYENRPIYFPLVSVRKNFFAWVNIHRWNDGTLSAVLANYLKPDRDMLEARVRGLREDIVQTTDKRTRVQLEDAVYEYGRLHEELAAFTDLVTRIAERGPDSAIQEAEAAFVMDLDDGVMVNSAALWELVQGEWKDPKKWWITLSAPAGKKDFDWSHLAMRYWPKRVLEKVKKDPSLAVAHSDYGAYEGRDLFTELHPAAAKKWEEQQGKKGEETFVKRDSGELGF